MDPFTSSVIEAMGPETLPRTKEILSSLIRHSHDFIRETGLTSKEWIQAMELLRTIPMITEERNEPILICDVLGIESLVVDQNSGRQVKENTEASENSSIITSSTIVGPFYRADAPFYENGSSIVQKDVGGQSVYIYGHIYDSFGNHLENAKLEVWQNAPNGLYESQDPAQPDCNLHGIFHSDDNGFYDLLCIRPTKYPIPTDGPAGALLRAMDRSVYRPSHIHFRVSSPGYETLVTQVFDSSDEGLQQDAAFAVKADLTADFLPSGDIGKGKGAELELKYDFVLASEKNK